MFGLTCLTRLTRRTGRTDRTNTTYGTNRFDRTDRSDRTDRHKDSPGNGINGAYMYRASGWKLTAAAVVPVGMNSQASVRTTPVSSEAWRHFRITPFMAMLRMPG